MSSRSERAITLVSRMDDILQDLKLIEDGATWKWTNMVGFAVKYGKYKGRYS